MFNSFKNQPKPPKLCPNFLFTEIPSFIQKEKIRRVFFPFVEDAWPLSSLRQRGPGSLRHCCPAVTWKPAPHPTTSQQQLSSPSLAVQMSQSIYWLNSNICNYLISNSKGVHCSVIYKSKELEAMQITTITGVLDQIMATCHVTG